jgi:hypothetical protein
VSLKRPEKGIDDLQMLTWVAPREIDAGMSVFQCRNVHDDESIDLQPPNAVQNEGFDATFVRKGRVSVHDSGGLSRLGMFDVDLYRNHPGVREEFDRELRPGEIQVEVVSKTSFNERLADHLAHTTAHGDPVSRGAFRHSEADLSLALTSPHESYFQPTTNWNVDDLECRFELVLRRNLACKQQCDGVPAAMTLDEMYVHECSTVDSTERAGQSVDL